MGGGLAGRYREIKRERERQGGRQTDRTGQDRTGQAADPRDKEFPKKKKKKTTAFSQTSVFPSETDENDQKTVVFISFARENCIL